VEPRVSVIFRTEQLTKHFGALKAVDGVDLSVEEGTVHAIIGPNGAGKTTFFNMLTGDFPPTSGRIVFRTSSHEKASADRSRSATSSAG
jgi:branched-chain amino acid transport system ATP-binding protein